MKRKVGAIILIIFFLITSLAYATLDRVKLENWDNYLFWVAYPRGAKPVWLDGGVDTITFRGGTNYTVFDGAPKNVVLRGEGEVTMNILRPDGKEVTLTGKISGEDSLNSNTGLALDAIRFAINELSFRSEDRALFSPTRMLFSGEDKEPLRGTYRITVSPGDVEVTIVGSNYGLLGTDYKGRDLWVGFVGSTVNTLTLAFLTMLFVILFGLLLGVSSGYYETRFGEIASVILEALNSLPYLPLAVIVIFLISYTGAYGRRELGTFKLTVVLALLLVGKFAGAVKGIVMHEKREEYVEAARALGAGDLEIIRKHIIRAVIPYTLSYATLLFSQMIAVVSILGLFGIIPGVNWGSFVAEAFKQSAVYSLWWWPLSPSVAIILVSVGLTLLSDSSSG